MKTIHAIYIFLVGFIVEIIGALFKILHLPGANEFLIIAVIVQVIGVVLIVYKLFTNPMLKEILNK